MVAQELLKLVFKQTKSFKDLHYDLLRSIENANKHNSHISLKRGQGGGKQVAVEGATLAYN